MKKILKYGMSCETGKMVSIMNSPNGEACNCVCAECGETLIARQGEANEWHFAHKNGKTCIYSPETALHLLAKEIVVEENMIILPDGRNFQYTEYNLEKWMPGLRPDIKISNGYETIFIEIAVTNKIKSAKEDKIRDANLVVMEIDLCDVDRAICKEKLKDIVIHKHSRKRFIVESKDSFEREVKGDNWIINLLFILLGVVAIWTIGRCVKRNYT